MKDTTAPAALWDVKTCAIYLNKSQRWLWREIARGNVPHVRVGQTTRFIPEDIAEWVRRGCPKPAENCDRFLAVRA